jgi:hypothetical protein
MQTIQRGNAAEAAVLAALVAAEIPVLLPFGDGLSFDLAAAIPPHGELVRIQVKSGRVRNGCVLFNTRSTDHGAGQRSYVGRADVIAVHVPDPHGVFVVAVDECPRSVGALRIRDSRNNQRLRVRFAKDYTLEAWLSPFESRSARAVADAYLM